MWDDPIVAEVHRAREKLAADCNYDISVFFAELRKRQTASGRRMKLQPKQANEPNKLTESAKPKASPAA
jgi:hypothetical protein